MSVRKQRNIVVLGFSLVGKTAICKRFTTNIFKDEYEPTCENSFLHEIEYNGDTYELIIADTEGDNGESVFRSEYGVCVHGYVLVYSINSRRSFEIAKSINDRLLNLTGNAHIPRILIGNKLDLDYDRHVSTYEGRDLANKWGCDFLEVSAKANKNVSDIFIKLLRIIERANEPDDVKKNKCIELYEYCTVEKLTSFFTFMNAFVGLFGIIGGIAIRIHSDDNGRDTFSYGLFGLGIFILLVTLMSIWGIHIASSDYLKVTSSSFAVIATSIIIMISLSSDIIIVHNNILLTILLTIMSLLIIITTSIFQWKYQKILIMNQVHMPYTPNSRTLYNRLTTNNDPYKV